MTRIHYTLPSPGDGEPPQRGGWFTLESAQDWDGNTEWDGSNHYDINTGDQWSEQMLYRTAQGRWVLGTTARRDGDMDTYVLISPDEAREWLLFNDHDEPAEKYFGEIEDETGPNLGGRPEIGAPVQVRLGDLLAKVDTWAAEHGATSRADAVRQLVDRGLQRQATT